MSLVLDASTTLSWLLPDEDSAPARHAFEIVRSDGGWVPGIWRLEIANGLQLGVRRSRIGTTFREAALADLAALPITVDAETDRRAWSETLSLADRFGLTLYDACYLELALRRGLPLATLDSGLHRAATAAGIEALGQ
jgi:predicted nucleic acid-binding protein